MRIAALVCNLASLAFTLLVLLTDGVSPETVYRVLTVALIVVPALSSAVLLGGSKAGQPMTTAITVLINVGSLAAVCWALVDQYPHPAEPGFLIYVVLTLATPLITIVALLTGQGLFHRDNRLRA